MRVGDNDEVMSACVSSRESAVVLGDVVVHGAETRRRALGELADEGTPVIVSHLRGAGRFERFGKGFRWTVE